MVVTIWGVGAGGKELTYIVTIATTHMMNIYIYAYTYLV